MFSHATNTRWSLLVVATAAAFTLAACGSSGSSTPAVASAPSGAHSGGSQGGNAAQASGKTAAQAAHDAAACLRAHGVAAQDPVLPITNANNLAAAFGLANVTKSQIAPAAQACQAVLAEFVHLAVPPPPWGTTNDQKVKFAQCMRTTGGVPNWPDLVPGRGDFRLGPAGIDPNSPQVLKGEQTCNANNHH